MVRSWVVWLESERRHVAAVVVEREEGMMCWDFGRGVDQKERGCFWMDGGGEGSLNHSCDALGVRVMMMVESL